jgi:hypothetical protein
MLRARHGFLRRGPDFDQPGPPVQTIKGRIDVGHILKGNDGVERAQQGREVFDRSLEVKKVGRKVKPAVGTREGAHQCVAKRHPALARQDGDCDPVTSQGGRKVCCLKTCLSALGFCQHDKHAPWRRTRLVGVEKLGILHGTIVHLRGPGWPDFCFLRAKNPGVDIAPNPPARGLFHRRHRHLQAESGNKSGKHRFIP